MLLLSLLLLLLPLLLLLLLLLELVLLSILISIPFRLMVLFNRHLEQHDSIRELLFERSVTIHPSQVVLQAKEGQKILVTKQHRMKKISND